MKPCQKHSAHLAHHGRKRHAFVRKVTTAASSIAAAARGEYNLLGEYGNGGNKGAGRIEYLWLPTETGQAQLIGLYRNNRFYAIHADPLGTPRLITDDTGKPVWQWPYSAFGDNPPSGILKATANPKQAYTNQPVLLKATKPAIEVNLRYPGQYFDEESDLSYNYFRSYQAGQGRYTQGDPIGLDGGWNRFSYVEGNPLSMTDPMGLMGGNGAAHRGLPSVALFGCLGLACASYGTQDSGTQYSAEFTLGGGIEICDPSPPPPQTCSKTDGQAQAQPPGLPLPKKYGGAFIGPSFKSGGRFCVRLGPHVGVPFTPSFDAATTPRVP